MPTYVSILNWSGEPQPGAADVRRSIDSHGAALIREGLHSLAFLPDEGDCAAIMVATCPDEPAVERLAAAILPDAAVRADSLVFDDRDAPEDDEPLPAATSVTFHRALLKAIVVEGPDAATDAA